MPTPDEPTVAPPTVDHIAPSTDVPETVVRPGVAPPIEQPFPATIAGYMIEGRLGKGGMGIVYKARQPGLDRIVALKMILNADHAGPDERRRFLHEAKALAELRHPNIVQVYEAGEHEGNPFISLEYIDGGSLDAHLAGTPLPPRDSAILVEKLARGMQAAHDAGIIHRDLKPANILLSFSGESKIRRDEREISDSPLNDAIPKITDFGLAKKIADAGQTQSGAILGTPSYMAPEQAGGKVKELDARADVYALGAILYECLTGRPPFRAATVMDTLMQVVSEEPVPPSQLNRNVPRDLETVCLKCLQKTPAKRYETACGLADDLARFACGEPVQARPVGKIERGWRWCRRNPAVASLTAAVAILLVAGATIATVLAIRADQKADDERAARLDEEKERKRAEKAEKDAGERLETANQNLFYAQLMRAEPIYQQQPQEALELLHDTTACPIAVRDAPWHFYDNYCQRGRLLGHTKPVTSVSFSPDGTTLASGSWDNTVKLWDVARGQTRATLSGHTSSVDSVSFSPDGKTLASASHDKTVILWDLASGQARATLSGHTGSVDSVSFSPDGKTLASGSADKTVKLWDVASGQARATLTGRTREVLCVSFSPDGKTLASGSYGGTVKLWDVANGQARATLSGHTWHVTSVSFSPDGKTLASGSLDKTVKLWDVADGQARATLSGHTNVVYSVSFSPDGKILASGDNTVKLWDVASGQARATLSGHIGAVHSVSFSPDGKTLVSGSGDTTVKLWDVASNQARATLTGHTEIFTVSFSADGKSLASGSPDKTVKLWNVASGQAGATLTGHTGTVTSVSFSPDGKTLASASQDKTVKLWDVAAGQARATLSGHTRQVTSVSLSPDGKTLASGSGDTTVKLWDVASGQARATLTGHAREVSSVSFSPDGKTLASGSGVWDESQSRKTAGEVKLWDVTSGQARATLTGHTGEIHSVSFSPDGKTLASGSEDGTVKLWDVASGQARAALSGHTGYVYSVSFSPDGKTLASASHDKTVILWDLASGQARATLTGHISTVHSVSFSPDGKTLASGSLDKTVKLWDVAGGQARAATLTGHNRYVSSVSFSPDGNTLASGCGDGTVKLWDVASGKARATLAGHAGPAYSVSFSPDGKILASGSGVLKQGRHVAGEVKLWDVASGQARATLTGHTGRVWSVSFSLDGSRLVSRADGGDSLVWNVQTAARVDEPPPQTVADNTVSPDGNLEVFVQGHVINLVDRRWKPHLPPQFQPDPSWHREQFALAAKEMHPFAVAFHQSRLAGFEPWNAKLRLKEAEAWSKATQPERAARAFLQAVLLDPRIGTRSR